MMITRRRFIAGGVLGGAALGVGYWPEHGMLNSCLGAAMLHEIPGAEVIAAAWEGINPELVWDCHAHLIGVGDDNSGIWINPDMESLAHPMQSVQKRFYLNASCTEDNGHVDSNFVASLIGFKQGLPAGTRVMLLAFDYHYDEQGRRREELSSFYTPNHYAALLAKSYPEHFHWIASVHPYRKEAVAELERAIAAGAKAVKWLPPAMGMDPASPLCDSLYEVMAKHHLPLLTHAGHEQAVHGGDTQDFGNPLRLRRALEHGVPVIVAHCGSLGAGVDLDKGANGPQVENFELFARLMDEPQYEGRLFGDISAITQINRLGKPLGTVLQRDDWHHRLLNGSDHPLPGVMPLFSVSAMVKQGYLEAKLAEPIAALRHHNPLLFDFVLKRHLAVGGKRFATSVFETGRTFAALKNKRTMNKENT
jgi:predicted TIM-barrel fold metal-dependent hydrolase